MKQFSDQQIEDLYVRYVRKDASYFAKYQFPPLHLNTKDWRWEDKDFARIPCLLDFREWVEKYSLNPFRKVLITDPNDPELAYISARQIINAPYELGRNDLHMLDLPDKDFDFIMIQQTLEHLYNPFVACSRLFQHLAVGGHLFASVPTINIPHLLPSHFWGITPIGLCTLMIGTGFEIVELGYWGNERYITQLFREHNWPDYRQLMTADGIANEERNCCQCWVLAKKP